MARRYLAADKRLTLYLGDGDEYLTSVTTQSHRFDFIFADTWPGKLRLLNETIQLLVPGGFYIVDDMLPQPTWDTLGYDHAQAIKDLVTVLNDHARLHVTHLAWDTGIIIGVNEVTRLPVRCGSSS